MKYIMFAAMMSFSLTTFAKNIQCEITPLLADKGGYVLFGDEFVMETKVQKVGENEMSKCAKAVKGSHTISFCASEASFVGGFDTYLTIEEAGVENQTVSLGLFGTPRIKTDLVQIITEFDVLSSVQEKLLNANIQIPLNWDGGDSLQLDDAVKEGINKKILMSNEVLLYSIKNCK